MKIVWSRDQEMQKLQKQVDELLDKINESGIESLTRPEVAHLKKASQKLREWEEQGKPN